jgi:hypothetical protein
VQVAAGVAAAAALFVGMVGTALGETFDPRPAGVVASSPDYEIMSYRIPVFFRSDVIALRLRSRAGLASREGRTDLACFASRESGAGVEWLFDRATFVDGNELRIFTKDGRVWPIRFDAKTLSAETKLDRCTNAPDPVGAD